MEYITLNKPGIKISCLGIGSLQGSGLSRELDQAFVNAVKLAIDSGINLIDTAEGYGNGHAEKLVAEAVKRSGKKRQDIIIASKFSHNHSTPTEIRTSLEATLKRFNTDYIDIYQQHWPPTRSPLQSTIQELVNLKKAGKIRAVGVCNWMDPEFSEITDLSCIDTLQPCYNLLWRSIEPKVIPMCLQHGIEILSYSPLCQGLLTGRFVPGNAVPASWQIPNLLFKDAFRKKLTPLFKTINDIASHHRKTVSQVSLRWVLQSSVTAPIIGASSPEQLTENLGAFGWELTLEEKARLDSASAEFSENLGPHNTMWGWHSREVQPVY